VTYVDQHTAVAHATPARAWELVSRLGGDGRLYAPKALWRARGAADRLVGGPGHRILGTGRPLRPGDPMDFWEVVEVRPPTRLRLLALARLPGRAHLDITVGASGAGSQLGMRTTFEPAGPAGHAYWWSSFGAHWATFELMTRRLVAMVEGV
jgi:Protein of unknown function (DUF2867)